MPELETAKKVWEILRKIMPSEVNKWLMSLRGTVSLKGPTAVAHSFVQMGVVNPEACDCDMDWVADTEKDPLWNWIHYHHRELNGLVHQILAEREDLIPKLRRVFLRDLKTLAWTEEEDRERSKFLGELPPDYVFRPTGKIVWHSFSRELLDNFLVADRKKSNWF